MEKHSKVKVAARNEEIPKITFLLDKIMSWAGFNGREILEVQLAVEEACNNIIRHGYRGSEGDIRVAVDFVAGSLKVTIEDDAPQFDPTYFDKPDFTADLEKRPVGGLGIHLIRSMVDEMKYELQDGKNRLILAKRAK